MIAWPVVAATFMMGMWGMLHCAAMCSALQKTLVHSEIDPEVQPIRLTANPRALPWWQAELAFQSGRVIGYATLGALAGASVGSLFALSAWSGVFRLSWVGLHVVLLLLGVALLALGRQPRWLDWFGMQVWALTQRIFPGSRSARTMVTGMLWALLPCGLLYSALGVAMLSGNAAGGAVAMAGFAAASALATSGAGWLMQRLTRAHAASAQTMGIRLSGAVLATMAAITIFTVTLDQRHPFCNPVSNLRPLSGVVPADPKSATPFDQSRSDRRLAAVKKSGSPFRV